LPDSNSLKQLAAEAAARVVEDGMVVGLGSGSTAAFAVEALGKRVQAGLKLSGIPTSESTAQRARRFGIPLIDLTADMRIDLTIDGADEVESVRLDLIKGRGGALLREKLVATASQRLLIVVDESKMVEKLGRGPLPVEVVPFGWESTMKRLQGLGATPQRRLNPEGKPFLSDGGHYILDCTFDAGLVPASLADALDRTVGVVEHGLFLGMASQVYLAGAGGVRVLSPARV
jgi:ribose 5-phosphate isomerase A